MKVKIKRSLAMILALVMALSLAACGGDKDKGGTDDGGDKAETITLGKYTAVFKGYTLTSAILEARRYRASSAASS